MIPQINVGGIAAGMGTALQILVIFAFIGVFVFIGFKKKWLYKYPTKFLVYRVMGGQLSNIGEDFGRRVIKKNKDKTREFYYDIKKANFKWYPPSFEFMTSGPKGRAVVHVREISHNNWEAFDPSKLVKGEALEYRSAEKNELDDYFKNTQDDAAEIKFSQDKDKWQKVIDVLPIVLMLIGVGVAIMLAMGPLGDLYTASMGANNDVLARSVEVLNQTDHLFNAAMNFCSSSPQCLSAMGITPNVTADGTVIIP